MKHFSFAGVLFLSFLLSGCAWFIDKTTDEPIQIDPTKLSPGEKRDDRRLKTVISVNLRKADPQLKEAHINVHAYNSVILLTGEVASDELRRIAGTTARQVNKVRQVYNELTVGPPSDFKARTADNWLQSKIKSKLVFNGDIDSSRVKIIVEKKVVFLMGKLTQVQAEKITETVRTTKGVDKVVRAIEYIE